MGDYIKKNISNLKPSATLAINEKVKKLLKPITFISLWAFSAEKVRMYLIWFPKSVGFFLGVKRIFTIIRDLKYLI